MGPAKSSSVQSTDLVLRSTEPLATQSGAVRGYRPGTPREAAVDCRALRIPGKLTFSKRIPYPP
jgi:hypothetical protein